MSAEERPGPPLLEVEAITGMTPLEQYVLHRVLWHAALVCLRCGGATCLGDHLDDRWCTLCGMHPWDHGPPRPPAELRGLLL